MNDPKNDDKREELIEMVREVQNASACMVDFDLMLSRLEAKFGDPRIGELIFDPPGGTPLSAAQIVDMMLN